MQPLRQAHNEITKARRAIFRMEDPVSDTETAWFEFLHSLERSWNKLHAQLKLSLKYQGWTERGRIEKLRRKDPLLAYLKNARGAEEHIIEDISKRYPGSYAVNPTHGNELPIDELLISRDSISIRSPHPISMTVSPSGIRLLPITNRGNTYEVPTEHLGKTIETQSPIEIARLGLKFLEDYVSQAENKFVTSHSK